MTTTQFVKTLSPESRAFLKMLKPGDYIEIKPKPGWTKHDVHYKDVVPSPEIHKVKTVGTKRYGHGEGSWLTTTQAVLPCGEGCGGGAFNKRSGAADMGGWYISRLASKEEYSAFLVAENQRRLDEKAERQAIEDARPSYDRSGASIVETVVLDALAKYPAFCSNYMFNKIFKAFWAVRENRWAFLKSNGMLPGEEEWLLSLAPILGITLRGGGASITIQSDTNPEEESLTRDKMLQIRPLMRIGQERGYWLADVFSKLEARTVSEHEAETKTLPVHGSEGC
jgi:hypothetical protein